MPTVEWLKKEFHYGYQSGEILSPTPDARRANEEKFIGGSYHAFFTKGVLPYLKPDSRVLELGPGAGSWTRALLHYLPEGEVHTCDFQDVTQWLNPQQYAGRLHCHKVEDNLFSCFEDGYFDFFFSFGVLVHCNQDLIEEILRNSLPKVKRNAFAMHNYGDWKKLSTWGWQRGGPPERFKQQGDDEIWWPRNTALEMKIRAQSAGWSIENIDLNFFARDGIVLLRASA